MFTFVASKKQMMRRIFVNILLSILILREP